MTPQPKLIRLRLDDQGNMTTNATIEHEMRAYSAIVRKNFPVILLSSDLRIIYCNSLFETLVQDEPSHILGKELRQFLDYNTLEAIRKFTEEGASDFLSKGQLRSHDVSTELHVLCRAIRGEQTSAKFLLVFNPIGSELNIENSNKETARIKEMHRRSGQIYKELFQDENEINSIYPDCFVINQPQDQIGGDYYRIEMRDNTLQLLIGDSSGHSIASSFVSMMTYTLFRHFVYQPEYRQVDFMQSLNTQLSHLNRKQRRIYDASTECMVLSYDIINKTITYTSAGIRGFIVRGNDTLMMEFSKSRLGHADTLPYFSSITTPVQTGDRVFLFTDGLSDQFGGQGNKRFSRRLTEAMLTKTSIFPMAVQKDIIQQLISSWKGSNEQTDDILLLSFSIH